MKKNCLLLAILVMATCISAFGQKKFQKISASDFATPAEASDTTVDAVFIYEIGRTEFTVKPSRFSLDTEVKARIHILTEKGREYANKSVVYYNNEKNSSFDNDNVTGIDATAYNLVDGKVVKTSMSDKYVFRERVNDNYMRVKFSIPEVKVGTIIEYKYTKSSPRFADLPSWYMQHEDPVRYSYYRAIIPDWFNYHIEERGYSIIKGDQTETTMNLYFDGENVLEKAIQFTVEGENLSAFKREGFIYCKEDYMQRVDFELLSATIPGQFTRTYTKTWNDVRLYLTETANYGSHLKIKNPYASEMASLGLEGKPASVKASRIFAFLKNKLKWNKTYALASDNPLKAVKESKGSNADLNFIYMAMLRDAGVKATPLLMRGRNNGHLPLTYASIDKLQTFLVAIADESGALFFADCSADYGDVNILPVEMLAEGVLLDPTIATNPASQPTRGEIYDLSAIGGNLGTARIDAVITPDGKITGQRIYNHTGENAMMFKMAYHEYEDSVAMIEAKEKALSCTLKTYKARNAEGTGRVVDERIRFVKDIVTDGGKLYFNPLVFEDEKTNHFKEANRVLPIEFPFMQTTKITSNLSIPEGYTVETMPQNQHLSMEGYLDADIKFELNGNTLVTNYECTVDDTFIPADKYKQLQDFWNGLLKMNSMIVCLKKQ